MKSSKKVVMGNNTNASKWKTILGLILGCVFAVAAVVVAEHYAPQEQASTNTDTSGDDDGNTPPPYGRFN